MAANEEVKVQNKMLDTLEAKIDDVHDHVSNINSQLKTTLDEVRLELFAISFLLSLLLFINYYFYDYL